MYDVRYDMKLQTFVESIDPLKQVQTLRSLHSPAFLAQCGKPALQCLGVLPYYGVAMLSQTALPYRPAPPYSIRIPTNVLSRDLMRDDQYLPAQHHAFQSNIETPDYPIVLDTGASSSLTPILNDFIGPLKTATITEINGIGSTTRIVGVGTVEWHVRDYWNIVRVIHTTAYYAPDIQIRLFSPQVYFQENDDKGKCIIRSKLVTLDLPDGTRMEFPVNRSNNLPFMLLDTPNLVGVHRKDAQVLADSSSFSSLMSVSAQTNQNITPAQKELLLWHHRLGHAGFQWCQTLLQTPRDVTKQQIIQPNHSMSSTCNPPMCAACQLAKQNRRTPSHPSSTLPEQMILREGNVMPGDCVSIDQYISALPGRLPHTKGKESQTERFNGGTIFVDHATTLMYLRHQVALTAGETLRSKLEFEQFAETFGVKIKHYRADNVPFGSHAFQQNISDNQQTMDFSGTGAHHQNGVAERAIQTVTRWARAMLLHAVIMWPDQADLTLWPFAMEHAIYLWNNMPKKDHRTAPLELFSSNKLSSYDQLRRLHVWGCPVYVLDPKLQDGKKIPKWNPRSRRGQYLGVSMQHSSTIGRILNLTTGFVSPQYHVVYDDLFSTVPNAESGGVYTQEPFNADVWNRLVSTGIEQVMDPDQVEQPYLHDDWLTDVERQQRQQPVQQPSQPPTTTQASEGASVEPDTTGNNELQPIHQFESESIHIDDSATFPDPDRTLVPEGASTTNNHQLDSTRSPTPVRSNTTTKPKTSMPVKQPLRQSTRVVKKPIRLIESMNFSLGFHGADQEANLYLNPKRKVRSEWLNHQFLMAIKWDQTINSIQSSDCRNMLNLMQMNTTIDNNTVEWMHPGTLAAKANAADTPAWEQAMNGPDSKGYWEACEREISTLQDDHEAWEVVQRQDWMNVLPSTWAFRCKRYPDGTVRKLKARFCARGDRQIEGVDFFDTFAPVVNWNTVRLLLILSIVLGLSTRQVDYTAAFVHALIDKHPDWSNMTEEEQQQSGVYLEMTRGFKQPGKILRLKRSLYGLRQSPRNFFQHLKGKLESIGFTSQVNIDPCLFVSDKVICLVYVDDTLLFSPRAEYIDEVIEKLRKAELALEEEDSVAGFLGVHLDYNTKDGSIKLTQKGLIKRIVEGLNLGNHPRKLTPASSESLVKDEQGERPNGVYSYSSIIGMLQYLQGHSRPDITYAVSQCARFTHAPRRSHEVALERIGLYLKGTMEEGLILKPTGALDLDVYVDADFAGLWPYEDKHDPMCVKSRTGFVICLANCPVVWMSKLQTEIALSTMEAEYIALSYAMRHVIPFQSTVKVISHSVGLPEPVTNFRTTVWEDNAGALILASLEPGRVTPRSKHFAIKYHWFRSKLKPNSITISKIETKLQKADILTKGLTVSSFQSIRKLLCGW